ncbi:MAG TPA: nucleotide exchange factor GrpE, partial [Thermomonas sp.]|nr:nucleotide exchange factor GrpE [Thermomonas sp.]
MDPTQDTNDATSEVDSHDPIEALHAEIEQLKAQSLVERADLDNQRKRLARDIEMARKFANERLLSDLL